MIEDSNCIIDYKILWFGDGYTENSTKSENKNNSAQNTVLIYWNLLYFFGMFEDI